MVVAADGETSSEVSLTKSKLSPWIFCLGLRRMWRGEDTIGVDLPYSSQFTE